MKIIEVFKKQRPIRVIKTEYGWNCPRCAAFWATYKGNFIDTNYCPNCGQAIVWEK